MNLTRQFSRLKSNILNFALPIHCTFCGSKDSTSLVLGMCKQCIPPTQQLKEELCEICKSTKQEGICNYCESRNVFFERLEFLAVKDESHRNIMNKIKFKNEIYLGNYFRILLNQKWKNFQIPKISYLSSVPSNSNTRKTRPYPPTFSVMNAIQDKIGLKEVTLLEKLSSEKQSEKAYRERFFHAKNSFTITDKYKKQMSGNVLLVDDIFTTGATVNEASKILIENGADKVYLIVVLKGGIL